MANKALFASVPGALPPGVDTTSEAGGAVYSPRPKAVLAQYAATGCLNNTFYADAPTQLGTALKLSKNRAGFHRALCAILSVRAPKLLSLVFARAIDSPKCCATSYKSFIPALSAAKRWVPVQNVWSRCGWTPLPI